MFIFKLVFHDSNQDISSIRKCCLSILFVLSDSQILDTGNDLKETVTSESVLLTSGEYDLTKGRGVTQGTQTSPEVPWPAQSVNFVECSFGFSREQVMGKPFKQRLSSACYGPPPGVRGRDVVWSTTGTGAAFRGAVV